MKKILLIAAIIVGGNAMATGNQLTNTTTGSGLYMNLNDYSSHKLSGGKFVLHNFLGSSKIKIVTERGTKTISKNSIYGYHDAANKDYRYFKNEPYQIVDTASFYIYYRYYFDEVTKGKGLVEKDGYYFSKKGDTEIMPLTIENLKKAFPENTKFHYLLDDIRNDKDLIAYDEYRKEYKIKYLLQSTF